MVTSKSSGYCRTVVLDTETTGINKDGGLPCEGHNIIEIGAIEIISRKRTGNNFHTYIKPDRRIQPSAIEVHGITDDFLLDKPSYQAVQGELLDFIKNSELVAHNASFDVGFINYEFNKLNPDFGKIEQYCKVTDTLALARKIFPGKRNNLNILCERYGVDHSHRMLHGALLDAEILADVYLLMTGGQTNFQFPGEKNAGSGFSLSEAQSRRGRKMKVLAATTDELKKHDTQLSLIQKRGKCFWLA